MQIFYFVHSKNSGHSLLQILEISLYTFLFSMAFPQSPEMRKICVSFHQLKWRDVREGRIINYSLLFRRCGTSQHCARTKGQLLMKNNQV